MTHRSFKWAVAAAAAGVSMAVGAAPEMQQVLAAAPTDLSVTVYRAPYRGSGGMTVAYLGGFALIRETRLVHLPAGVSRVRFEGVADGIEPVSAIITGLTDAVIEKNLDAQLLSPRTLMDRAAGKPLTLMRTNPKTGQTERLTGVIRSGSGADGVVFQTGDSIEALRCSGLPETFTFVDVTGLSASPTLSVAIRSGSVTNQRIQLSYLARSFDWSADYTATVSADGKTIDLGAWVTLANGNGVGFPAASTQVVAGRLNHQSGEVEPIDAGGPVLARCWPAGRTSDPVELLQFDRAYPLGFNPVRYALSSPMAFAARSVMEVTVTGSRVKQEQLGDLKLYRVPLRTSVASRQSKQVRLLDRAAIPVRRIYGAQIEYDQEAADAAWAPASVLLRTRNDTENHLGLPLPSGRVSVFQDRDGARLLLHEAGMRDLAVNEEVEIDMGKSSDVQVRSTPEEITIAAARVRTIPLVPGVALRAATLDTVRRIEISNARNANIEFEIVLNLNAVVRVVRADHALSTKNGHPAFRFSIPANSIALVRYQTAHVEVRGVSE